MMYDDALMREPWQQGITIITQDTKRWNKERRRFNDELEARMIFARFTAEDQGRSRIHIATCETAGEAEAIVRAHNKILELYTDLCGYVEGLEDDYTRHAGHRE